MTEVYNEQDLGHGDNFYWPKLHRFLHQVKWCKQTHGEDSFDYEQQIVKLAQLVAAMGDMRDLPIEELYHYFHGHHKADINNAVELIQTQDKMMSPREGNLEERYNNKWVVRDTENYMDGFGRPWLSQGYNQSTDLKREQVLDYNTPVGLHRPDADTYIESYPEHPHNEKWEEKLKQNSYLRMLFTKEERAEAKRNMEKYGEQ